MFSQQTRHITSKSAHLATARTRSIQHPTAHLSELYGNSCLQVGAAPHPIIFLYLLVNKNGLGAQEFLWMGNMTNAEVMTYKILYNDTQSTNSFKISLGILLGLFLL